MIVLGILLLLFGLIFHLGFLWTIGIILLIAGLVMLAVGAAGHSVGGRRHWW